MVRFPEYVARREGDSMNPAYQHLSLADVRPGMILSDELLDRQGQVLLPAGAVLTASTIALLPGHGIDALAVRRELAATVSDSTADAANQSALEGRLAKLFRKNDSDDHNDWATGILRRYVEDYRLQREIEQ